MSNEQLNLLDIFKQVSKTIKTNQASLNEADDYNHDHGDHMVEIFDVITTAMKEKKSADPADQLEYAAQLLRQKSSSGSAQVYAKGLTEASKEISGKTVDMNTILPLLQTLMSGGETKTSTQTQRVWVWAICLVHYWVAQPPPLLQVKNQGLDLGDLLGAGLSYMQSKQSAALTSKQSPKHWSTARRAVKKPTEANPLN
jgi:hypothetical protein